MFGLVEVAENADGVAIENVLEVAQVFQFIQIDFNRVGDVNLADGRADGRDAEAADEMFETLMGEKVVPRREFIEKNALNVRNLDV